MFHKLSNLFPWSTKEDSTDEKLISPPVAETSSSESFEPPLNFEDLKLSDLKSVLLFKYETDTDYSNVLFSESCILRTPEGFLIVSKTENLKNVNFLWGKICSFSPIFRLSCDTAFIRFSYGTYRDIFFILFFDSSEAEKMIDLFETSCESFFEDSNTENNLSVDENFKNIINSEFAEKGCIKKTRNISKDDKIIVQSVDEREEENENLLGAPISTEDRTDSLLEHSGTQPERSEEEYSSPQVFTENFDTFQNLSIWKLDRTSFVEIIKDCVILLDSVAMKLYDKNDDVTAFSLSLHLVSRFRQHEKDMIQLNYESEGGTEQYGIVFSCITDASTFSNLVNYRLVSPINCKNILRYKNSGSFVEFDRTKDSWVTRMEGATIALLQRELVSEIYLVVCMGDHFLPDKETSQLEKTLHPGSTLAEQAIHCSTQLYVQPDEKLISWTGPAQINSPDSCSIRLLGFSFDSNFPQNLFTSFCQVIEYIRLTGSDFNVDFIDRIIRPNDTESTIQKDDDSVDCSENIFHPVYQYLGYDESCFENGEDDDDDPIEIEENTDLSEPSSPTKTSKFCHRAMDVGSQRAFVVRSAIGGSLESHMQIWNLDEENRNHVVATINPDKFHYGTNVVDPNKILLKGSEEKIWLTDRNNKNALYVMDVEREKIINEWNSDCIQIENIVDYDKTRRQNDSVIGYNSSALFTMDARIGGKSCARTTTVCYSKSPLFTCGGTDNDGHIAMGSYKGEIRLYDGTANASGNYKKAKTLLPGFGDPLKDICVSKNGDWILGTADEYLILYPVKLQENGRTGFTTALGKKKPQPIFLRLQLDDIKKYNLQNFQFTKAQFDERETNIITAVADLLIVWDFRSIRLGLRTNKYIIRRASDTIKGLGVLNNPQSETIVTALPESIHANAVRRAHS